MDLNAYRKLVLFGGSFDPPHIAHVTLPTLAMKAVEADLVVYIPSGVGPFKQHQTQTPGHHRLHMLRLAIEGIPNCHILTDEIDRTLALMEPQFKGHIEVIREYESLPEVNCYPGQLNQVFLNLLMNACDVLEDGGTITIRARPIKEGVRLEFEDSGPGISAEVQRQIFDPFFTTKEVGKGTGLGLSLSHGIIERHGGRIQIVSQPGEGAIFQIELPLVAPGADGEEGDVAEAKSTA